jgi:hypothetical protein
MCGAGAIAGGGAPMKLPGQVAGTSGGGAPAPTSAQVDPAQGGAPMKVAGGGGDAAAGVNALGPLLQQLSQAIQALTALLSGTPAGTPGASNTAGGGGAVPFGYVDGTAGTGRTVPATGRPQELTIDGRTARFDNLGREITEYEYIDAHYYRVRTEPVNSAATLTAQAQLIAKAANARAVILGDALQRDTRTFGHANAADTAHLPVAQQQGRTLDALATRIGALGAKLTTADITSLSAALDAINGGNRNTAQLEQLVASVERR